MDKGALFHTGDIPSMVFPDFTHEFMVDFTVFGNVGALFLTCNVTSEVRCFSLITLSVRCAVSHWGYPQWGLSWFYPRIYGRLYTIAQSAIRYSPDVLFEMLYGMHFCYRYRNSDRSSCQILSTLPACLSFWHVARLRAAAKEVNFVLLNQFDYLLKRWSNAIFLLTLSK